MQVARGGDVFGHESDSRLWLGAAEVTTGGGPGKARVVREFECTGRDDFAPPNGTCGAVLDAFLRAASDQRAIPLLSIHGFQYTFEDALAELERIVQQLERGQLDLEGSIRAYERGTALRQHCAGKLAEVQLRVDKITADRDGKVRLAPFEG